MIDKSPRRAARIAYAPSQKLIHRVDGELRIVSDPPAVVRLEELVSGEPPETADSRLREWVAQYADTLDGARRHLFDDYTFVDAARKVAGVGSVGTRAWIVLFVGRDEGDPLLLQVKEAQQSVLEPYTGQPHPNITAGGWSRVSGSPSSGIIRARRTSGPSAGPMVAACACSGSSRG